MLALRKSVHLGSFLLGIALFTTPLAQEGDKGDLETDPYYKHLHLYFGPDVGYNYIYSHFSDELDKHGFQVDIKGLLSYSWTDITLDAGAGCPWARLRWLGWGIRSLIASGLKQINNYGNDPCQDQRCAKRHINP